MCIRDSVYVVVIAAAALGSMLYGNDPSLSLIHILFDNESAMIYDSVNKTQKKYFEYENIPDWRVQKAAVSYTHLIGKRSRGVSAFSGKWKYCGNDRGRT